VKALADFHLRRSRDDRAGIAWIAEAFLGELEPLGLAESGALERWLARGAEPVRGGRARGHRIALPGSGRAVHVRELAHGGILRALTGRRFLGTRRGRQSLAAASRLRARGVGVPAPVLLRARRHGIFFHVEIGNEFVDGCTPGGRFLATASEPRRRAAAREAGRQVRAFHEAGGSHPDLHVDNLLVDSAAEPPVITITDLDGVRVTAPPAAGRRMRELARLDRSLAKRGWSRAARRRLAAAFLDGYTAGDRRLRTALLSHRRKESLRTALHRLGARREDLRDRPGAPARATRAQRTGPSELAGEPGAGRDRVGAGPL
jgi:tRNA A-37 threonylcarbamoyl transferase component Bud32